MKRKRYTKIHEENDSLSNGQAVAKIQQAINKIEEAREMIDEVMILYLEHNQINRKYYVYGEYGISQLLGECNPTYGSLQDIINTLKKEGL